MSSKKFIKPQNNLNKTQPDPTVLLSMIQQIPEIQMHLTHVLLLIDFIVQKMIEKELFTEDELKKYLDNRQKELKEELEKQKQKVQVQEIVPESGNFEQKGNIIIPSNDK